MTKDYGHSSRIYVSTKGEARALVGERRTQHKPHDAGDFPHYHALNSNGGYRLTVYYGSCGAAGAPQPSRKSKKPGKRRSRRNRESGDLYFREFDQAYERDT